MAIVCGANLPRWRWTLVKTVVAPEWFLRHRFHRSHVAQGCRLLESVTRSKSSPQLHVPLKIQEMMAPHGCRWDSDAQTSSSQILVDRVACDSLRLDRIPNGPNSGMMRLPSLSLLQDFIRGALLTFWIRCGGRSS